MDTDLHGSRMHYNLCLIGRSPRRATCPRLFSSVPRPSKSSFVTTPLSNRPGAPPSRLLRTLPSTKEGPRRYVTAGVYVASIRRLCGVYGNRRRAHAVNRRLPCRRSGPGWTPSCIAFPPSDSWQRHGQFVSERSLSLMPSHRRTRQSGARQSVVREPLMDID
jgi:hypothetical protein